ncbi:hypothetical protein MWU52_15320 [Jannaschia sp. S6380]|uniref:hypothetical protein n=1 Tax=Jannaschia sp. S6380 TaxID=2926408 RepID=UPI001FF10116|nr:hypothetical protein [Jannaschia sp. S6380]MCK0168924.1 hypothetical protein [Jannaschia sp. S6380]
MAIAKLVHDVTEHLRVYLLSGTLVAVGIDVATNVTGSMGGGMSGAMAAVPMQMDKLSIATPFALLVQGIGLTILAIGAALYAGNMWCGYAALRNLRFRFRERGPVLMACGWSLAFLYVLASVMIGIAVNAVYLALVN